MNLTNRFIIALLTSTVIISCGHDTPIERIKPESNNSGEIIDSSDQKEIEDYTPRFTYGDYIVHTDEPGVLCTCDYNNEWVKLRSLNSGDVILLSNTNRNITLNNRIIAYQTDTIKTDDINGIVWIKGIMNNSDEKVYLVWKKID